MPAAAILATATYQNLSGQSSSTAKAAKDACSDNLTHGETDITVTIKSPDNNKPSAKPGAEVW